MIDIGGGVLGILPQLRSQVGTGGRVVGLDFQARLLAVADQLSAQHGLAVETVLDSGTTKMREHLSQPGTLTIKPLGRSPGPRLRPSGTCAAPATCGAILVRKRGGRGRRRAAPSGY